jgi:hypothetical protein
VTPVGMKDDEAGEAKSVRVLVGGFRRRMYVGNDEYGTTLGRRMVV